MHSLWLVLALCAVSPEVGDGSLVFLQNCNSVVEYTTRDEIGHVALVFREGSETWIYEATPGKVRRLTWGDYQTELARINAGRSKSKAIQQWVVEPKQKYDATEVAAMQEHLDVQLGRRYSVKNYVRGKPGDGTHCAELAANTLNRTGRYAFAEPHKIHPAELLKQLEQSHRPKVEFAIGQPEVIDPWYVRWGRCCSQSCNWCGWSCGEAWSFVTAW
ncbi:hypothetical protein ETAA8_05720 [Anatilimnocola aggregata]|uniref:Uncharacterized protein n=1 Tax=Anatilimnocola aggregata TaxID=2528021 RepID=A0A517Y5I3_9BACT|nr:hypothetical protein [Anatilimnocola aggregata]QDU25503.1 hypothetical protein ETAA8_05720 [Anatilimnocola aggregata]